MMRILVLVWLVPLAGWAQFDEQKGTNKLSAAINYQAEDSIVYERVAKKIVLYNSAQVNYQRMQLNAYYVEVEWEDEIMHAYYAEDSAGNSIQKPLFIERGETYEAEGISYHFKEKKVFANGIVTKKDEAYMHGGEIRAHTEERPLYIRDGKFTTCSAHNPHFHIRARKIKFADKKVMTSPFLLYVRDLPLPVGFAFGIFPQFNERNSGIIVPYYGEERNRGFFLRRGGYYFAINDYMTLSLEGDVYSKGSYANHLRYDYKKRYQMNGHLDINYNNNVLPSPEGGTENRKRDLWVRWRHTPVSRGAGRLQASVDFGTSSYNQNNLRNRYELLENSQTEFSSNVTYSRNSRKLPINQAIGLRHQQNLEKKNS